MPNRLATETSPYLLQHAGQSGGLVSVGAGGARPGEGGAEADLSFDRLLGLPLVPRDGAREFRERRGLPRLLNEHFVCIKVDREERPDLDQIYMNAVQMMTGRGGWPMSVFLTPDLKPFYGGTYWPPTARGGNAGLRPGACSGGRRWHDRAAGAGQAGGGVDDSI